MNLFRRRRDLVAPMLLLLNVSLVLVLLWALGSTPEPPSMAKGDVPSMPREELPLAPSSLSPLDAYTETLERPLFSMNRRPEDANASAASAANAFILTGVVITPTRREALLLPQRGKDVLRGKLGDWVNGWKLETIEPERVTLRRGTRQMDLVLERPWKTGASPTPQAAASAGAGKPEGTK